MPHNPLTLTRQALYDLVWSKPVRASSLITYASVAALARQ